MAGIYIHIPFCKNKCSYCDFHFSTSYQAYYQQMISCIVEELITRKKTVENDEIQTIYFGGGTPSLLLEADLKKIVDTIYKHYNITENPEVTLEANPDDISANAEQLQQHLARKENSTDQDDTHFTSRS